MDKIIINYLYGNISLEEQHKLKKWLEEDEAHPVMLSQMEKYWAQGELKFPDKKQAVYQRIKTEIQNAEEPIKSFDRKNRFKVRSLLKYAAVILVASALSVFIYSSYNEQQSVSGPVVTYVEKVSLAGQKVTTVLPDGTKVKLNAGSKIIVPDRFVGNTREVTLKGEAFFDVVPNASKPFIIHFDDNQVTVLGTSFNIKAYQDRPGFVAVKTGKVMVQRGDDKVQLHPNEMTDLNESALQVNKLGDSDLIFGWVGNKLSFNKASINEVLETVSNWYGVSYELKKEIEEDKLYTASHSNPTLKEVMEILTYTYEIEYEIVNNTVIIK